MSPTLDGSVAATLVDERATDVHADSGFDQIAQDLQGQGYGVYDGLVPADMVERLYRQAVSLDEVQLKEAGIGREGDFTLSQQVRRDKIHWIDDQSLIGCEWQQWAAGLQNFLNRRLFLGLFSFESHFARYQPGDFYRRHVDAFRGKSNRVLTVVLYLNPQWQPQWGGELALYQSDTDLEGQKITPCCGRLVVFLSEEFPHEVLPARHDRYSIAGWFRINGGVA